ncbi:DUF5129 domain-containing protein [Corynebacterium lizhenjunii]|uniref:DUF5129 domain-containing protein n=1 Tax=Corynebacterium lizhenjunii TaxID=2709394 RepID=UPI001F2B82DC|nr:DUF5129 domain-containing protein [Corynebacterium lizhenjunii]
MTYAPDFQTKAMTILGSAVAVGLLSGVGAGAVAYSATEVPQRSEFSVSAPIQQGINHVEVHDPDNVLSAEDEARLQRDAERIKAPDVVQQLHFLVFAHNHDNVNDTVEEYLRDNHPHLIGDESFAEGTLFVGVGLDPRQAFVFSGEDVAALLSLHKGHHLEAAIDAIKPGVKDNNIPAGLFAGAAAATNTEELAQSRYQDALNARTGTVAAAGLGTGGTAFAGVAGAGFYRRNRRKKLAQAREDLAFITREYGELAQRLDAIDIRANSLTSPLAHATMRAEWEDVRDRFLNLHQQVDAYGGLTASDDPKKILAETDRIQEAADTTRQLSYAEDNIDRIFRIEHGDPEVRAREVSDLRADIMEAEASVDNTDSGLYRSLAAARAEADKLVAQPDSPDFLDRYTQLLKDYHTALTVLKKKQMSEVEDTNELHQPTIYESDYRAGYGYMGFVPFWTLDSWHNSNIEAAQSSTSSSSVNSGFSSGFSGAGGSSSF